MGPTSCGVSVPFVSRVRPVSPTDTIPETQLPTAHSELLTLMKTWFRNVGLAITTIARGMYVTLWTFVQSFRRKAFTQHFEYPEKPVAGAAALPRVPPVRPDDLHRLRQVRPRLPGRLHLHREGKGRAAAKGFVVTGFKIDYTKCMFCALCVDPCPVDCIFMGSNYDLSSLHPRRLRRRLREAAARSRLGPGDAEPDRGARSRSGSACRCGRRQESGDSDVRSQQNLQR